MPCPTYPQNFRKIRPQLFELSCLHTDKQTNRQTKTGKNITSLAEVKIVNLPVIFKLPLQQLRIAQFQNCLAMKALQQKNSDMETWDYWHLRTCNQTSTISDT